MADVAATATVRRIYANLGLLLTGKASAGLISLGYLVVAARALGPADYGVLVLVHAYVLTVGGIVNFPGWHAVVRYGARAETAAAERAPRLLRLLRLTAVIELAAAAAAIAIAAALVPVVGPRLGWSPQALALAGPYSLAVLAAARSTPAGYLQLRRRFGLLGLHNVIAPAVRLLGSAAAAAAGWGLVGFLWVWLAAAIAEGLAMWTMGFAVARREFAGRPWLGGLRGVRAENPGVWRFMLTANADVTFGELAGRLAPLAVGWVLGPAGAGLYAVAQRAGAALAQPALVLGQAAYAELARLAPEGGGGARIRGAVFRCIGIALLAAVPIGLLVVVFAPEVTRLLAGRAFAAAAPVLACVALARLVLLAGPPCSAALVAMGRPGLSVSANVLAGAGLFPLLLLLLSRYGLIGAGVHALLQAGVATALLTTLVVRATGNRGGAHGTPKAGG